MFLQLLKEKLTNLHEFPPLSYKQNIESPLLFPLLEFQKTIPPIDISHLISWYTPLQRRGEDTMNFRCSPAIILVQFWILWKLIFVCQSPHVPLLGIQLYSFLNVCRKVDQEELP